MVYSTVPLFWIVIHPNIAWWRRRKKQGHPAYKAVLPLWVGMWICIGAVSWPWRNLFLYRTPLAWIAGVLLIFSGLFLYSRGRQGFSPLQFSGQHEIEIDRHEQVLVISGIRRRMRHPIYCGHLCEMLGWAIGTGGVAMFALAAFAVLTGAVMIRMEDAELEQRFGEQYLVYRREVPAFLPRFW